MNKQQENEIMEVLFELFPSMKADLAKGHNQVVMQSANKLQQHFDVQSFELGSQTNTGYDPVTKPSHYNQHGVEAIQAIEASMSPDEFKGYLKGSVMKYVWRYTYKGKAVEDLEKAQVYLDWLIERVKKHG